MIAFRDSARRLPIVGVGLGLLLTGALALDAGAAEPFPAPPPLPTLDGSPEPEPKPEDAPAPTAQPAPPGVPGLLPPLPPAGAADPAAAGATGAPTGAVRPPAPPTHDLKLRELEEKVIGLKEKVHRSKVRLLLLKERILNDVIGEAKVVVVHDNQMGPNFKVIQVHYHLDGEKIYFQDDTSDVLATQDSIEIANQNMAPGNHVLAVEMIYQGDSAVFPYLEDYLFKLRSNHTFYATKGKVTTVRAIGYLKGDITYDLRDRPSITFDVQQVSYTSGGDDAAKAPAAKDGSP